MSPMNFIISLFIKNFNIIKYSTIEEGRYRFANFRNVILRNSERITLLYFKNKQAIQKHLDYSYQMSDVVFTTVEVSSLPVGYIICKFICEDNLYMITSNWDYIHYAKTLGVKILNV